MEIISYIITPVLLYFILRYLIAYFPRFKKWLKPEKIYFEKVSRLFKDIKKTKTTTVRGVHKFIRFDKDSYINRKSNKDLEKYLLNKNTISGIILKGKSMMGKTSMVYNEIIRSSSTLKRWRVIIPEDVESLKKWDQKLPLWILPKNKILFIDDLNKFKSFEDNMSGLIDELFKKRQI